MCKQTSFMSMGPENLLGKVKQCHTGWISSRIFEEDISPCLAEYQFNSMNWVKAEPEILVCSPWIPHSRPKFLKFPWTRWPGRLTDVPPTLTGGGAPLMRIELLSRPGGFSFWGWTAFQYTIFTLKPEKKYALSYSLWVKRQGELPLMVVCGSQGGNHRR